MNHTSGLPYGQVPMSGRRHDMPYPPIPPNMRPQPQYQSYYHPHMAPPMAQYSAAYPQPWYQYQHIQHHPPPPRQYSHHGPPQHPQHYGPLVVSSYSQSPAPHANAHVPPPFVRQTSSPRSADSPAPPREHLSPTPPSASSITIVPQETPPSSASTPSEPPTQTPAASAPREPFYPPVPWLSVADQTFPSRAIRGKRRIPRSALSNEPVIFPQQVVRIQPVSKEMINTQGEGMTNQEASAPGVEDRSTLPDSAETPTPQTSEAPSELSSTQPTTPSSALSTQLAKSQQTPTLPKTRPAGPVVPAVPVLPTSPSASRRPHRDSVVSTGSKLSSAGVGHEPLQAPKPVMIEGAGPEQGMGSGPEEIPKPSAPPAPPKSWADLVRSKGPPQTAGQPSPISLVNGIGMGKNETLSDVLHTIGSSIGQTQTKLAFLQPRGLENIGNMCYMNSVLQVLIFCVPFYEFLDRISRKAAHSFKGDTPVIDALIMFMREYLIIDSADSPEQLRLRLKPEDFENFGKPFTPEYVYAATRDLPRFRDMRRGQQQDAQEFLGLLLEELHDECAHAMKSGSSANSGTSTPLGSASNVSEIPENDGGWMEVGHKQKPAITRSSGAISTESPITRIFGGKLRSELKVAGSKNSITLEPYQPLQLDIGSPQVNNIVDALKGLTRPESMQGDFHSPRGPKNRATKQVFIETLPPVLILHLKRFHYDNSSKRAEKIWKKIGYPLELEIPKEVFPLQLRNKLAAHGGFPKYRLTGVIYHHGKSTNGGHYTVDIRRHDGLEWIRLDDTVIRRVRGEDVAAAGSEEDPKVLTSALEQHNLQKISSGNMFEQIDQDEEDGEDEPEKAWSQVNGHARSKSTTSAIFNGATTSSKSPSDRQSPSPKASTKDKVAYLLFYHRISG